MPAPPSYVGLATICAVCMHGNADADRNFCEKNIQSGACGLDAPKPLYRIDDT